MKEVAGAILAGGKARRMGSDKALVPFQGNPMIERVSAALRSAGLDVLVVGRDSADGNSIRDLHGFGGGPAVGLLSAFEHLDQQDVFLVAVDQPLLRPETITQLLQIPGQAVVPMADGHPQVTCALYRHTCHGPLRQLLEGGDSKLRRLLDHVDTTMVPQEAWQMWGEDGRSWMSLDTPEAVRNAEALR